MKKRILYILLAIAVVAQFFQPDRSVPAIDPANDMLVMTQAPQDIRTLVEGACYDCHSYSSTYPWYAIHHARQLLVAGPHQRGPGEDEFLQVERAGGTRACS